MKRFLIAAAFAVTSLTTTALGADVGVSISVGQPCFYGQINVGDFPEPRVIYTQPVIVDHEVEINTEPIYLHVPPRHYKHWDKYCNRYHACNRRVLFVHDDWYQREYVPRYQERHHGHGDDYRDDRRDDRQNDHHDNGHEKQKYEDKWHGNDR